MDTLLLCQPTHKFSHAFPHQLQVSAAPGACAHDAGLPRLHGCPVDTGAQEPLTQKRWVALQSNQVSRVYMN
eukprot:1153498-Pelagomonas_calceolata.AAC.1